MCLSDTAQFNESMGRALAYDVVEPHEPIHVQIENLSNEPVFVKKQNTGRVCWNSTSVNNSSTQFQNQFQQTH